MAAAAQPGDAGPPDRAALEWVRGQAAPFLERAQAELRAGARA